MTEKEKLVELILKMDITDTAGNIADFLISNGVRLESKQATSDKTSDGFPLRSGCRINGEKRTKNISVNP